MPNIIEDKRVVTISLTKTEMLNSLGVKAKELGIIDFTPDDVEIKESSGVGMAFDVTFEKTT